MEVKFIVDINAGKLARWLRIIGYDTLLFNDGDDSMMIKIALQQNRVILTRDTQIIRRRLVTSGELKAILIEGDNPKDQFRQIVNCLDLDYQFKPFSLCLECNHNLIQRSKDEVRDLIPSYVFKTQSHYMECPACHRIYWQGTHWQRISEELEKFMSEKRIQSKTV